MYGLHSLESISLIQEVKMATSSEADQGSHWSQEKPVIFP